MQRPVATRLLVASLLLAAFTAGCGPETVENSPEVYDTGSLDEVGQLYLSVANVGKKPPTSLGQLAGKRDLFLIGYNAIVSGDIIVYWGVTPTPGDAAGSTEEILAYKSDVPTNGGPVLLKDLSIKTMTAADFQAAPKPSGPTSVKRSTKS